MKTDKQKSREYTALAKARIVTIDPEGISDITFSELRSLVKDGRDIWILQKGSEAVTVKRISGYMSTEEELIAYFGTGEGTISITAANEKDLLVKAGIQ